MIFSGLKSVFLCAIVLCLGMVSGCASDRHQATSDTFDIYLSQQGLRQFNFTMTVPPQEQRHSRMPAGSNGSAVRRPAGSAISDPHKFAEMVKPRVLEQLHLKLEETGYCPEGYTVVESQFGRTSFIRGHCVVLTENE
ncbi:MAG: hypothetical protein M0Q95_12850 [Porticoccaceae bacterium]|nr:hypothetical protein [Porticoccaceae bacterium]